LRSIALTPQVIGPHNVHVSIYENGSTDRTVELIGHLAWLLDSLGATFTVHAAGDSEQSHKEEGHRIHVLAALRNKLIAPLRDPDVVANSPFRTVLFMNDIQVRACALKMLCGACGRALNEAALLPCL